jgi:hypothetical protein
MSDFKSATPPELIEHIVSGDSKRIVEAAREAASRKDASVGPHLLRVLERTNDPAVRNAVALALSDLKEPSAFDMLVDLLKSGRVSGNRGTLLYALGAYNCSPVLPLLVDLVIEGNFEESRQALSLITGIETEIDEHTWQACVERLRSALATATEERRPLLGELLSLFEQEQ